jgi:ubiquinone/menaquinone biosynthesis C-methylase UbiE
VVRGAREKLLAERRNERAVWLERTDPAIWEAPRQSAAALLGRSAERQPERVSMQVDVGFWDERARKCEHTGWADATIYAYDQLARLQAIERIIASAGLNHGTALDFGTGSGDFASLLGRTFTNVVACDISSAVVEVARRKHGHHRGVKFLRAGSPSDLGLADGSLDLVLSITVLGHIMNDDDLRETVRGFRRLLRESGVLIALEYTPAVEMEATRYQRFLTFDGWLSRLSACGFVLRKHYGFYHPKERLCPSYDAYRSQGMVRLLGRLQRYLRNRSWITRLCTERAEAVLARSKDFFWEGREDDAIRIMLFDPGTG